MDNTNINKIVMNTNPYDEIIPNLYLGGIKALDNYNINCNINCNINYKNDYIIFYMVVDLIKYTNMVNESMGQQFEKYINLPVNDSPDECDNLLKMINDTQVLEKIYLALQQDKPVLVHCFAGMQRSCALVASYLIKYHNFTPINAIDFIKTKRPIAFFGNVNFMDLLLMVN